MRIAPAHPVENRRSRVVTVRSDTADWQVPLIKAGHSFGKPWSELTQNVIPPSPSQLFRPISDRPHSLLLPLGPAGFYQQRGDQLWTGLCGGRLEASMYIADSC